MKKLFLILISVFSILCSAENRIYAQTDTIPNSEKTNVSNDTLSVDEPIILISQTQIDDTINIDGHKICFEQAQTPEIKWYQEEMVQIGVLVIAVLGLVFVFIVLVVLKYGLVSRDEIRRIVSDYSKNHSSSGSNVKLTAHDIQNINNEFARLDYRIKTLENSLNRFSQSHTVISVGNSPKTGNVNTLDSNGSVSSKDSRTPSSTESNPQSPKTTGYSNSKKDKESAIRIVKYAQQDASNSQKLMNVSDIFDKYAHTFIITLDQGSESEGTFQLVDDETVIQECLNNNDSILCCVKNGMGTKVTKQVPGRVSISGDIANVKTPAQIYVQ